MKRHCLNLEGLTKGIEDTLNSFFKKTGCDLNNPLPKYKCRLTGKMCVANFIEGSVIKYDEGTAERCPVYIPPGD